MVVDSDDAFVLVHPVSREMMVSSGGDFVSFSPCRALYLRTVQRLPAEDCLDFRRQFVLIWRQGRPGSDRCSSVGLSLFLAH
jgi:hypothetical protein